MNDQAKALYPVAEVKRLYATVYQLRKALAKAEAEASALRELAQPQHKRAAA